METFSALLDLCAGNSPVIGEFLSQRPVTRSFDFFDPCLNKRLSKQSRRRWFEKPSCALWLHYIVIGRIASCPDLETFGGLIRCLHYSDAIMVAMASQITIFTIVYSTFCSGVIQIKHHSSASMAFVGVMHRWPVNSGNKWPVTRKTFPFDDVIMNYVANSNNTYINLMESMARVFSVAKSPQPPVKPMNAS